MAILDNSPSRNKIRWVDMKVLYNEEVYNIKDGFTDKTYVYWDLSEPNKFLSSDTLPYDYVEIVVVNNGGIHTMYPNTQITVSDSSNLKLKYEHLDKSLSSLRSFSDLLNNRITSIEKQVVSIREYMNNMDKRLKTLEGGVSSDV